MLRCRGAFLRLVDGGGPSVGNSEGLCLNKIRHREPTAPTRRKTPKTNQPLPSSLNFFLVGAMRECEIRANDAQPAKFGAAYRRRLKTLTACHYGVTYCGRSPNFCPIRDPVEPNSDHNMQPVTYADLFMTMEMKLCGINVEVRMEVRSMSKEALKCQQIHDQCVQMYPPTQCRSLCACIFSLCLFVVLDVTILQQHLAASKSSDGKCSLKSYKQCNF